MNISIRDEAAGDVAAIDALTIAAFLNAPHTSHTEQFILSALRRSANLVLSLVAILEGKIVGHVAVSAVSISDGTSGWFGLGPISVMPEHQGQGVGSRLMREVLRRLHAQGAGGCVLLGEPEYYRRFGFKAQPNLILPHVPAEFFQALALHSPVPRGTVTYHEAFDAQD